MTDMFDCGVNCTFTLDNWTLNNVPFNTIFKDDFKYLDYPIQ